MPDVGTLNIEITSNAEEAAKGLGTLASKLGSVKSKADGFDLSNVQANIRSIVEAVKGSEKTMSSLGTLFNATASYFKAFGKITDKININTKPIEDLKKAFGEGIKTGNVGSQLGQLRAALEGEWNVNNAYNAGIALSAISEGAKEAESANLAAVAKDVSSVASALSEYAYASERVKAAAGTESIREAFETLGVNASAGMVQGIKEGTAAVGEASAEMTRSGFESAANEQQSNSPSLVYEKLGSYAGEGYVEGIRSKISDVTAVVAEMVQSAIAASEGKTAQVAESVAEAVKTAFSSALEGMDISEAQKAMIQRTANMTADVVKAMATSSKADLAKTGNIAADIISASMNSAAERAIAMMHPLQDGMQQFNAELQSASSTVENNIDTGIRDAVDQTAEMNQNLQMTNEELQEQLRIRREILDAQNQARLESNYGLYRELYMSGEGNWKQQVPEMYGFTEKAIQENETYADALRATLQEVNEYVDNFVAKMNMPSGPLLSDVIDQANEAKLSFKDAGESATVLKDVPEVTGVADGLKQVEEASQTADSALERTRTATRVLTDDMAGLDKELKQKKPDAESAASGMNKFGFSLKDVRKGLKSAFPLISQLGARLKSIVIRRTLTAAIRKVVSGAKEGLQNVYEYSKLIGSSFAPAMDSAASSLAQMKNSLGAALAPALQALIPILQTVVNWFITAVNYVNQFFALLNGQRTWTRALPQTTSAFEKQTKAAKKTGAAIKDLLADWDELNIIQSQTSGSGSGAGTSAAEDYLHMFEEVNRFDNRIQDIVDFIKDNFGWMLTAVEGIGAAIMLWRISDGFEHSLGMLQKLELAAGLTLIITGIKLTADAGYDIGKNGINGENAINAVGGVLSTMIGGGLTGLAFAGIEGGLVGLTVGAALGLAVLAIRINEGHLDALYGDVKKDVDDIVKDLEENVLTKEASLEIDIINATVKDIGDAETKVGTALLDLAQSYPVNADITLDDAEKFISKVNTLVDETNNLIEQRKETMKKITVPSMAVFGPTFVDDAWGGISAYVTELGTQIGTELSKSTVDAVKLDDLRTKLMEMSMVIMNAQKSSEFTGAVSMISEGIRNNTRLGKYDRQTVETYVEEYNKLLQNAKNTASDEALQEYVSAFTLVQSLETKQRQMGEAFDQVDELEKAKKVLAEMGEEADYVAKKAEELYDEWTKAGRQVYGNIIAGALKTAISNNDRNYSYYKRQLEKDTAPREREIQNTDAWVSHYIREQYKDLYNIISINSGMAMDQVKKLLKDSDINPLSLLDEDFVAQYRSKIIEWLGKSTLDDSRRRTILEAFGLNFDEVEFENKVEKAIEETVKDAKVEPEVTVEPKLAYEIDLTNANDLYREINALIDNEGIFGKDRSGMSNLLLRLEWDSKVDDLKKIYDYILQNKENHGATTWYDWYNQENGNTGNAMNAARFIGMNNTVSDVGFGKYDATPSDPSKIGDVWGVIDTVTKRLDEMQDELTREDMTKAVETGTKNANRDQEDIVRSILSGVNALLRKNWTVNVNATSSLGMVNRASAAKVARITGHSYIP